MSPSGKGNDPQAHRLLNSEPWPVERVSSRFDDLVLFKSDKNAPDDEKEPNDKSKPRSKRYIIDAHPGKGNGSNSTSIPPRTV